MKQRKRFHTLKVANSVCHLFFAHVWLAIKKNGNGSILFSLSSKQAVDFFGESHSDVAMMFFRPFNGSNAIFNVSINNCYEYVNFVYKMIQVQIGGRT